MFDITDKYEIINEILLGFIPQSFMYLLTAFLLAGILIRFIKYLK